MNKMKDERHLYLLFKTKTLKFLKRKIKKEYLEMKFTIQSWQKEAKKKKITVLICKVDMLIGRSNEFLKQKISPVNK